MTRSRFSASAHKSRLAFVAAESSSGIDVNTVGEASLNMSSRTSGVGCREGHRRGEEGGEEEDDMFAFV